MRRAWPLLALACAGCTRMFFLPSREVYPHLARAAGTYEEFSFSSTDGTPLTGLLFRSKAKPARATIVHFHGNGQNMTAQFGFAFWLLEHGFDVLAFDYRGYGRSGGSPSVKGAVEDGIAAIRHAGAMPDAGPIVVYGQSLGGALAVASIARMQDSGARALVLESAFASYRTVARDKLARLILTWPLQWPLSLALFSSRYDPAKHMDRLPKVPLLIVHGEDDRIVPFGEALRLYRLASEPKELWRIPGAGHTEAFHRFGREHRPKLLRFLDEALRAGQPKNGKDPAGNVLE